MWRKHLFKQTVYFIVQHIRRQRENVSEGLTLLLNNPWIYVHYSRRASYATAKKRYVNHPVKEQLESSFADVVTACFSPSTLHICIELSIKFEKKYQYRKNFDRLGFQQYSDYTTIYIIQFFMQVYRTQKMKAWRQTPLWNMERCRYSCSIL
jgi:hypothetical protein